MYNRPWPPPRFLRQPPPITRTHLPPHNAPSLPPPSFDPSYFRAPPSPAIQFCPPHRPPPPPWHSPDFDSQSIPIQYPVVPGPIESISALRPVSIAPPPPPPSDPIQCIQDQLTGWLSLIGSLVSARRRQHQEQQNQSTCVSLSQIRNRFLRWHELIERIREGGSDDFSLHNELSHLQRECSDPDLVKRVQCKLAFIRRKRRYKKRIREQQKTDNKHDDDTVVVRCPISAVLERLRTETSLDSNVTERPVERHSPSSDALQSSRKRASSSRSNKNARKDALQIQQAVAECRERLALLSGLQRLRTARLTQARQKGGLFPEAFDQAFAAQINELSSMLNAQLTRLLEVEKQIQNSLTEASTPEQDRDKQVTDRTVASCCDHWPNLFDPWKQILFRSAETPKDIPWRWQRFYHQADFDFSDFLRIRKAWDSYIVEQEQPSETNTSICMESSTDDASLEPSSLPTSWHVPLVSESSDSAWEVYRVT